MRRKEGNKIMGKIVTCEQVFKRHPDKLCDQISDNVLDAYLKADKTSRVAVESAIKNNAVYVFVKVTSKAKVNIIKEAIKALRFAGYYEQFKVYLNITKQSGDIALDVDKEGAGDQGMMYGYATNETDERMPYPFVVASHISNLARILFVKHNDIFGPDGKCEVAVEYDSDYKPVAIKTIIISSQTKPGKLEEAKALLLEAIGGYIKKYPECQVIINPTGAFETGGPYADSGLTGRKLMCDTYGGVAHHGGGAFSGKDYTKVDRSGAYYARFVAKSIVKAGLADKCEIAVSYSIGVESPISVSIDTFGSGKISNDELLKLINDHFDFSVGNIIEELKLKDISYQRLAEYGHFGNDIYPWENVDGKVSELKKATAKAST
jgi:S-adenosylmethionine synthetase